MDASDGVVEEVAALFGGPVDADAFDGFGVASGAVDGSHEFGGIASTECEFGDAFEGSEGGDGHDAGDDGDGDAGDFAAFAEVVEVAVVEEELGDDVVGAGVDFGFEEVHFEGAVGGAGVSFGEAGDADAKAAGVGVPAETADEFDKVDGVAECVFGAVVGDGCGGGGGGVAAEGEDVGDAFGGVASEDFGDVGFGVADAGEVGDGIECGGFLESDDEVVGAFAGGSACAVGDGDEGGLEIFEFADVGEELFGGFIGFWGEEFKGEGGRVCGEDVANVHGGFHPFIRIEG